MVVLRLHLPTPSSLFECQNRGIGGFESGRVCHGTADELSLGQGLEGSMGASRMHITKTQGIIMQ